MNATQQRRPAAFQPEDYLSVLTGLCRANWCALAVMLLLQWWFRSSPELSWPTSGGFASTFNFIALEYGVCNLGLHLALHFRGWYENTPRLALNRLHHLAVVVLIWDSVHFFGAFEVLGGVNGPLVALVPLMLLLTYFLVPWTSALLLSLFFVAGIAAVVLLQMTGVLYGTGALGSNFSVWPDGFAASLLILAPTALVAILLGRFAQRRMVLVQQGESGSVKFDRHFDCFSRETLRHRIREELVRTRRRHSDTSLIIIELLGVEALLAEKGLSSVDEALWELVECIQGFSRIDSDTLAYVGDARFALLIPTANTVAAQRVIERIREHFQTAFALDLRFGLATVGAQHGELSVDAFETQALEALAADAVKS